MRGGAALSVKAVTGVPIKFIGLGEKLELLEPFHPDRMASRILGMGDVLSLVEKAQATFDMEEAKKMEKKLRRTSSRSMISSRRCSRSRNSARSTTS